jgi:hypothetical protein
MVGHVPAATRPRQTRCVLATMGHGSSTNVSTRCGFGGNVYLADARAYFQEVDALDRSGENPSVELVEEGVRRFLRLTLAAELQKAVTRRVNTELLGETKISGLGCEDAGGEPLVNDGDYSGRKRMAADPSTGPFEDPGQGSLKLRLW